MSNNLVSIHREGGVTHLETEQVVSRPLARVFPFFADAKNLERITPQFLSFSIVTNGPIVMREGTVIDYRLSLHGLPFHWRTLIAAWEPPHRFVDEQLEGPYRSWSHEHRFEERGDTTIVRDHVRYRVPGGALVDRLFVERNVRRIFAFRFEAIERWVSGEGV